MFEQEIKQVRSKLAKSLISWREADRMERKIREQQYNNEIFYIGHRLDGKGSIYQYAGTHLNQIISEVLGDTFRFYCYGKKEFKQVCEKAQNIKKSDVIDKLKQYINSKGWQHIEPEIVKDTVTIGLSDYLLPLLLSSLNTLINDDIETAETIDKARKALKNCNTFVYRNIKITFYKNGKTKLVFADKNIQENFTKLLTTI